MIWTYIKYIRNPFTLVVGTALKFVIKILLFKNLAWKDYNELLKLSVDLIPAQNWYNLSRLLMRVALTPHQEVTQIDQIGSILNSSVFHTASNKTIKTMEEESKDKSWKYFFISVILGGLGKKLYFFIRNFILLPFKIGTWLFMGGIVGIDVNKILHLFDFLRLNVPYWIYNKLVEVHINWLKLFRNVGQIESISTNDLEEVKIKNTFKTDSENINTEDLIKPKTFLGLDKSQWLITLGIGTVLILICAGIYINFYSSDNSSGDGSSDLNTCNTEKLNKRFKSLKSNTPIDPLVDNTPTQIQSSLDKARTNISWTDYFKNKISNLTSIKSSTKITDDIPSPFNDEQIEIKNRLTNLENLTSSSDLSEKNKLGLSNKFRPIGPLDSSFVYNPTYKGTTDFQNWSSEFKNLYDENTNLGKGLSPISEGIESNTSHASSSPLPENKTPQPSTSALPESKTPLFNSSKEWSKVKSPYSTPPMSELLNPSSKASSSLPSTDVLPIDPTRLESKLTDLKNENTTSTIISPKQPVSENLSSGTITPGTNIGGSSTPVSNEELPKTPIFRKRDKGIYTPKF